MADEQWHAPAVLPFELTNIVGTKMKQAPKEAALIEAALVTVNKKLASYAEI